MARKKVKDNSIVAEEKNKRKEAYKAHMLVLGLAFVFSMDITWELISLKWPQDYYLPLQFLFSSFFALYSLIVTKDIQIFRDFWEKHPLIEKIINRVLHFCTVFIVKMPIFVMGIPDALFGGESEGVLKLERTNTEERIKRIDEMPLIVRCIMLPAFICIVWVILQKVCPLGESISYWGSKILDFFVSLMGLFFLKVAVKENIIEGDEHGENN